MSLFVPGQEFPAWGPSVPVLKQREAHRLERTNKVLNEQVEVRGKVFSFSPSCRKAAAAASSQFDYRSLSLICHLKSKSIRESPLGKVTVAVMRFGSARISSIFLSVDWCFDRL